MRSQLLFKFALFLSINALTLCAFAQETGQKREGNSFSPTWRLMQNQEKQQFIAGYIQGWRDAAKMTDIAISYVRSNPERAVEGLEGIRSLYNLGSVKPSQLVQEIDAFYADPENNTSPLSAAITSAKTRLR